MLHCSTGEALDRFWTESCSDLDRAVDRLKLMSSQDALILLRSSFSAPRVQQLLRCSPSVDHADLVTFDSSLRSPLCHITNTDVTGTQWLQASLPIKAGGLEIRRVVSLHLLPIWLRRRAPSVFRHRDVSALWIAWLNHTESLGQSNMVQIQ